jgi:hypothetical protein
MSFIPQFSQLTSFENLAKAHTTFFKDMKLATGFSKSVNSPENLVNWIAVPKIEYSEGL